MRFANAMRMILRTPVKSLITFILIAAVTFGFSSQIYEYSVVSREMARLADHFRLTGTIESDSAPKFPSGGPFPLISYIYDKTKYVSLYDTSTETGREELASSMRQYGELPQQVMAGVSKLPHVVATSTRYMGAGVSDAYYRMDGNQYFYDYSARLVGEGVVEKVIITPQGPDVSELKIWFSEFSLLAGNPKWLGGSKVYVSLMLLSQAEGFYLTMGDGTRSGAVVNRNFTLDYQENIQEGDRLIFLCRAVTYNTGSRLFIGDTTDYWCDELRIITDAPDDYLQTEAFEPFRLAIEITNADMHTFDMVYTDDMMSIPRFADRVFAIHEGRALTAADKGTQNCVVSNRFLQENNLSIGSTITVGLGDRLFEQNAALGAVASVPERYKAPVDTVELTIVGDYLIVETPQAQAEDVHHTYSLNTIFVPLSLLPASADTENHEIKPGEFSFVLDHPNNAQDFEKNAIGFLEENGLTLLLGDNVSNWREVSDSYNSSSAVTLITIAIFFVAELAVGIFTVYLYISRRKREYSIMRVLGVSGGNADKALFVPLMLLGLTAILTGNTASWIYTARTVEGIIAQYPAIEGYAYHAQLSPLAAAGCVLLSAASLAAPALIILRRLRNTQPLMLLQDNQEARTRKTAEVPPLPTPSATEKRTELAAAVSALPRENTNPPQKAAGRAAALRHILRYVARHSRRTAVKSLLSILVSALLFTVIGQSAVMREHYDVLFMTMPITGYFTEKAPARQVLDLAAKPYLKESYYSGQMSVRMETTKETLIVTNNFERYTDHAEIVYSDGYDKEFFDNESPVCVINETLMDAYGLALGDEIKLISNVEYESLAVKKLSRYIDEYFEGDYSGGTDDLIITLLAIAKEHGEKKQMIEMTRLYAAIDMFYADAEAASTSFAIVGKTPFVATGAQTFYPVLVQAGDWYMAFAGEGALFDEAEFILGDNAMADIFKSDGDRNASVGKEYSPYLLFSLDLSSLENVERINNLMESLFPVIFIALSVIGAFFQALMIAQLAKDAGKMRFMGTTATRVCGMLALERIMLLLLGFVLSIVGLAVYNGAALRNTADVLMYCGGVFLAASIAAAVASAVSVSMRNPLKFLQMKE